MNRQLFFLIVIFVSVPSLVTANVVINEIAWMGTSVATSDEWIELYNSGSGSVTITEWRLLDLVNGSPDSTLGDACANTTIPAGGYYLLERTDDDSVPSVSADCIYTGALSNTSEHLQLLNDAGIVIDSVDASSGWPAGDNTTKETMQKSGGGWVTAVATPKQGYAEESGGEDTEENDGSSESSSGSSGSTGGSAGGGDEPYVPPEQRPHITANAGADKRSAVGEEILFRGLAWGLEEKPLDTARYVWNFGDGATQEGQNVGHIYMFPGTYEVRLVVSSGKYSAFDDARVIVNKNMISVSEVRPGMSGWIEFENKGSMPIHMGGWIMETTVHRFIIPTNTTIAAHSFAVLSGKTTGLILAETADHVYLFYPDGSYASGIAYMFQVPQGKSVSNNAGVSMFTDPTPGEQNKIEEIHMISSVNSETSSSKRVSPSPKVSQVSLSPEEPTGEKDDTQSMGSTSMQAAVAAAPVFSRARRDDAWWFGGSLVAGGLAAVAVVWWRRKKYGSL